MYWCLFGYKRVLYDEYDGLIPVSIAFIQSSSADN